jgi:WD40 repeat protein
VTLYDHPLLVIDPGMHMARITRASANRDGSWGVTGSHDKTVRIWSLATGTPSPAIRLPTGPGNVGEVNAVAISPDGALIAAGGWTRWTEADPQEQIYLFDRMTTTLVNRIEGVPSKVLHLVFSPDGGLLVAALGENEGLRIYAKAQDWSEIARDEAYDGESYGANFAPDGRLATTSVDGWVRLYTGELKGRLRPALGVCASGGGQPFGIAFSADGARLAVGYAGIANAYVLDGRTLAAHGRPDLDGIELDNGSLSQVAWSPDGQTLFAAGLYWSGSDRPVLAWDRAGAGERRALPAGRDGVMSLVPLPDGSLLVASSDPWFARLDPEGTPRWQHRPPPADFSEQFDTFSVSGDGIRIGFGFEAYGKTPASFDLAERKLALGPVADATMAVPRHHGLPIEWWYKRPYPTLGGKVLHLDEREHALSLAIHPAGDRFVLGAYWSLRAFAADGSQLWRNRVPAAVWAVNITGDGRLVVAAYADGTIRWHRMSDGAELLAFMPLSNRTDWVSWTPEGYYSATPGAHGLLRWHINNGWDAPASIVAIEDIPGSYRPNVLSLVLDELETQRALGRVILTEHDREIALRTNSRVSPNAQLHLLAIGISAYNEDHAKNLRLRYADRDASDLASALMATQASIYHLNPQVLLDEDATRSGIRWALKVIHESMRPGGNDLAVVFFSGHGALLDDGRSRKLYLLPTEVDARNDQAIADTALAADELTDRLQLLAERGRVLLLLDACHSGAATMSGIALRMDSSALRLRLADENITVLTSSSGGEASFENPIWQHGAFSKVLLDAFEDPAADLNRNRMISVLGLTNYVATRVPALTGGKQNPGMEVRFEGTLFRSAV